MRSHTLEEALGKDEQPVDMAVPCFAFPEHWPDRHPLDLPPKARVIMISLHPTRTTKLEDNTERYLEAMLQNMKIIALGEVGLDYHWEHSSNS